MANFHVTREFTDDDGESQFEDLEIEIGSGEKRALDPEPRRWIFVALG